MINNLMALPPALLFIGASLFIPFIHKRYRNIYSILVPIFSFFAISQLPEGSLYSVSFLHYELELLRVDKISRVFGFVFTLCATFSLIYGYYEKKSIEHLSILVYVGSALGVVFSGDIFSLYLFWELMAVFSTFLILSNKTKDSFNAAKRYILVHIVGGLILLAGIIITVSQTGSIGFNLFEFSNLGTWLILIGFLINAAATPFSSWLPDAYPQATILGGVILSAYTTKTAVYAIIRGFSGWDILIPLGCAMAIYGIIYAILENDIRRVLAFSIVNQVGFKLVGIGIGTTLAINGVIAHVFAGVIYTALLWMTAGSVIYRTGTSKFTQLGGLYKMMPITTLFAIVGALAISAFPFFSGYTTKTMIILAAEYKHMFWTWLILEIASAGAVLHAGLKYPYYTFFNKTSKIQYSEAPKSMLIGMGGLSLICFVIGCFPETLYNILPDTDVVKYKMSSNFLDIYIHHFPKTITKLQLLLLSTLAFFICRPLLKPKQITLLDFDWFYRKGGSYFYKIMDSFLNKTNELVNYYTINIFIANLANFFRQAPAHFINLLCKPIWYLNNIDNHEQNNRKEKIFHQCKINSFPVNVSGLCILGLLGYLILI